MTSRTAKKGAGTATLAKVETVALWHAVNWMETCLSEWKREGFKSAEDEAQHVHQGQLLALAKQGLRKANKIRKEQACRSTEKPQVEHKAAGGSEG
jgi:hypothetical protein